jgi:hypothetical protein
MSDGKGDGDVDATLADWLAAVENSDKLAAIAQSAVDGAHEAEQAGNRELMLGYEVLGLVAHVALRAHEGLDAIERLSARVDELTRRCEDGR